MAFPVAYMIKVTNYADASTGPETIIDNIIYDTI